MSDARQLWPEELLQHPHDAPDKASRVRGMFNAIAPRYELVNSLFSAGRDAAWRRKAVRLAQTNQHDTVLDIACGTGDFARAFASAGCSRIVGCDFAHEMLQHAVGRDRHRSQWCESDALRLPFADHSFSIASCAFGVRNFADLDVGLAEMYRVLCMGGRAVILEFSRPANRAARLGYELYANRFMPWAAALVSRDRTGAYRYLPKSVVSFPSSTDFSAKLREAGFSRCTVVPLTLGIVTVYVAWRD